MLLHPRLALFAGQARPPLLPVVDHYCGVEKLMRKSLALQAERGPVFDVTLDCEDGAAVGAEAEHMALVVELLNSPLNAHGRVGVRVHPVQHDAFGADLQALANSARPPTFIMLPKLASLDQTRSGIAEVQTAFARAGRATPALHGLIETHGALREVEAIAAEPALESLSFGLMDFVSDHHGAIPASAMGLPGQFEHPLVLRAKLAIAAACHGHGKTPSHCVVTELKHPDRLHDAARRASQELGYTRMWSIHPAQIDPILEAFSPSTAEIDEAIEIIDLAQRSGWAPTRYRDQLQDRASYRFHWSVLERAQRTGQPLPQAVHARYFAPPAARPETSAHTD